MPVPGICLLAWWGICSGQAVWWGATMLGAAGVCFAVGSTCSCAKVNRREYQKKERVGRVK